MNIAVKHNKLLNIEAANQLGMQINFKQLQNWLNEKDEIQQALIFDRGQKSQIAAITAFIELAENTELLCSKSDYVSGLKNDLRNNFPEYLLPSSFIFIDKLDGVDEIDTFEHNILQHKFKSWEVFDTQFNYWSNLLTGMPHLHNLPLDKSRQANHISSRLHINSVVKKETLVKLTNLSNQNQVSVFIVLQTLFTILIGRYSNDSDILMGAQSTDISSDCHQQPISNVNFDNLILRTLINDNPEFLEQLNRNKSTIQNAYTNHLPLAEIQKRIQVQESLSRPIFQIKIHYQQLLSNNQAIIDSHLKTIHDENTHFKHDLELSITNTKTDLRLTWFYNANIFESASISRLAQSFETLIDSVINETSQPVFNLPLFRPEETQQLLTQSCHEYPALLIHQAFEQQALNTPNAIALRFNDQSMTYQTLDAKANQLAIELKNSGISPGKTVAVYLKESPALIIAVLAILKADAIYMPLSTELPASNLAYTLEDSKVSTILSIKNEDLTLNNKLNIIYIEHLLDNDFNPILAPSKKPISTSLSAGESNAYLIYTSGSTKNPKGVVGTHKSVINRAFWMKRQYQVSESDVFCLKSCVSSVDHIAEIFQPLICGASLVLFAQSASLTETQLANSIYQYQITRLTLLPSTLKSLAKIATQEQLKSLKTIISSGEPLHTHLIDTFYKKFSDNITILNLYGSTETGADVSFYEVNLKEKFDVLNYFSSDHLVEAEKAEVNQNSNDIYHILSQCQAEKLGSNITTPNVLLNRIKDFYLESQIPSKPLQLDRYLEKLKTDMLPYLINLSSEKYIGHMTSPLPNFIPELNKFISKANQNVVKIETAKSTTFIERQVLAMLHRLFFNLSHEDYQKNIQNPDMMYGIVTSGGSIANITALYCARNASLISKGITQKELIQLGSIRSMNKLGYQDSVLLVSRLAHYSIKKAASLLGIGQDNLLIIEQNDNQKVNIEALEQLIDKCHREKKHIISIIGIAGATETGTIDPINEMANIAEKHRIHFHVDAAWGGAFIFSEKYKHKLKGIERADSITICAHKQLYIAQGMSVCLFKDPQKIFSIATHADYQSQKGSFDLGQFTLEGSRPALSLLLHASLHLLSSSGYSQLIEQSMEKAAFLSHVIEKSDCFQLVGENDLNIINYRYIPTQYRGKADKYDELENSLIDKTTETIQEKQFQEGKTFVSKTRIFYKPYSSKKITVFRIVLANPNTSYADLLAVLQDQLRIASENIENKPAGNILTNQLTQLPVSNDDLITVPIGKPIDNVNMYILDQYHNLVPTGVTGELYISGDCLASGYFNQEKLNQSSFIKNPFSNKNELMFKTNDLARRLADGNIEYLGRKDLQVKLNGHRVKLHEIKSQLDKLSMIKESVVLVENDLFSENLLTAYIELNTDINISESEKTAYIEKIKSNLAAQLPDFMIPSNIKIYQPLPLTPNGKVDFRKL